MKHVRHSLLALALVQVLSTLLGVSTLLWGPTMYAETLDPTIFAGQYVLAAFLLGIVGAFQWAAAIIHLRFPRWLPLAHWAAGLVMLGWIAGECLVLDSFIWPHALWGGLGAAQLALVAVLLGVFSPEPRTGPPTSPKI